VNWMRRKPAAEAAGHALAASSCPYRAHPRSSSDPGTAERPASGELPASADDHAFDVGRNSLAVSCMLVIGLSSPSEFVDDPRASRRVGFRPWPFRTPGGRNIHEPRGLPLARVTDAGTSCGRLQGAVATGARHRLPSSHIWQLASRLQKAGPSDSAMSTSRAVTGPVQRRTSTGERTVDSARN